MNGLWRPGEDTCSLPPLSTKPTDITVNKYKQDNVIKALWTLGELNKNQKAAATVLEQNQGTQSGEKEL